MNAGAHSDSSAGEETETALGVRPSFPPINRSNLVVRYFLVLLATFACHAQSMGQETDTATIGFVRRLPAVEVDPTAPNTQLEDWVSSFVPKEGIIEWEINDCGEQTGVATIDAERDMPMCVGAYAQLPGDRRFGITIIVGTNSHGPVDTPTLYDIYLQTGTRVQTFKHLNDLGVALKAAPVPIRGTKKK